MVVSGSVRSTPGTRSRRIWGKQTTNNKATGTVRRNQATRIWSILRMKSDSRISCCTTCVASEPASSTPAYLPELSPVAGRSLLGTAAICRNDLLNKDYGFFHRFQTRSLHDFLILHTKVDASHQTNFLARQDGRTNSIFQRFGLLFFHEWRQALARNTLW